MSTDFSSRHGIVSTVLLYIYLKLFNLKIQEKYFYDNILLLHTTISNYYIPFLLPGIGVSYKYNTSLAVPVALIRLQNQKWPTGLHRCLPLGFLVLPSTFSK